MNNIIQNVIEESDKKLDEIIDSFDDWVETEDGEMYSPDINKKQLKSHLTTTISKVLSAIEAEVEKMPPLIVDQVDDNPMVEYISKPDIQDLLKSAKEQIK